MDFKSYLAECRRDPEYRKVAKELKPILDLADEVFELRMERGWTQEELAERVGTAQANISRLENGLANPTFEFLHKLSEAFGTELSVSLRSQPARVETRVVTVMMPSLKYQGREYQRLFTMSVDVSARKEGTPRTVKVAK
jgi:transcriptional regulator with XRE-family HTH domain